MTLIFGKSGSPAVRAIAAMFFINGCVFGTWSALIPGAKAQLGASEADFGWLLFSFGAGALTGIFASMFAIPRLGSKFVLQIAGAVLLIAMAVTVAAGVRELFVASLFTMGLSGCLMDVAMNEQGSEAEQKLGKPILSTLHALWSVGGLSGAMTGGVFIGAISGLTFALAILLLLLVLFVFSQGSLLSNHPVAHSSLHPRISWNAVLIVLGLFAGCCVAADGAVRDWSALYISSTFPGDLVGASFGYGAYAGAMALFRLFGDGLRARFGRGPMLATSTIGLLVGVLVVYTAPGGVFAVLGFLIFGLAIANVFPILVSFAGQEAGASGVTFVVSMGYVAALSCPPIFGWVASTYSLATVFLVIGAPFVMVGLASLLLNRLSLMPSEERV